MRETSYNIHVYYCAETGSWAHLMRFSVVVGRYWKYACEAEMDETHSLELCACAYLGVNVYSVIVISVELKNSCLCTSILSDICLLLGSIDIRMLVSIWVKERLTFHFLNQFISAQSFDDESSLKLDTASNYVITWLRSHYKNVK